MSAQYPGAIKTFVNPIGTNTTNSPAHATQHADANDEITAIQTELGTDPAGSYATVKLRLDSLSDTHVDKTTNQTIAGLKTFSETLKMSLGVNVASSSTVTLGDDGNTFKITGTTTITNITIKTAGTVVILYFETTITMTDGGNLVLQGNYSAVANDAIVLVSDGTNWIEVARSQAYVPRMGTAVNCTIDASGVEATTDGFLSGYFSCSANSQIVFYSDNSGTAPTTVIGQIIVPVGAPGTWRIPFSFPIKSGNFYRAALVSGSYNPFVYTFTPYS